LLDIFEAVVDGRLADIDIKWKSGSACCVAIASGGYPGTYEKGKLISGLENVPADITVFHAGTKLEDGKYYSNGGRVLGVTATADTISAAIARAYDGVREISFEGSFYRSDIGKR